MKPCIQNSNDDKGFDFDICGSPETAFALFHKRINEELDPLLSWVGEEAFAEDGSVNKGYTLDALEDHTFSKPSRWVRFGRYQRSIFRYISKKSTFKIGEKTYERN